MSSDEVRRLSLLARQAAASQPDIASKLALAIRDADDGPADPYLITGMLIEGAVHLIVTAIPPERQPGSALAALRLLAERLEANGIL